MHINIYSQTDKKLGKIEFVGFNKQGEPGFISEDFTSEQIDFLVEIFLAQKPRFDVLFQTVNLNNEQKKQLNK